MDDLFLSAAVEWEVSEFQKRTGLQCRVRLQPEEISLDKECSTVLFRILQEALTNVARHSRAKSVEVSLERTEDRIVLVVRDDGIGISAEAINHSRSYGLIGMRERCLFWGGEVAVHGLPSPGHGTEVRVMIPSLK